MIQCPVVVVGRGSERGNVALRVRYEGSCLLLHLVGFLYYFTFTWVWSFGRMEVTGRTRQAMYVWRKTEGRSRHHCYREKAMYYIYWVCVCILSYPLIKQNNGTSGTTDFIVVLFQASCFDLHTGHLQSFFDRRVRKCYACWDPIMFIEIKYVNT